MRHFTKKLQEKTKGSYKKLSEKKLFELLEYVEKKGYRIIALKNGQCYLEENPDKLDHDIRIELKEKDALSLFKQIQPNTFSRKTPLYERFEEKK